ncbi:AroM family protein [Mesorhizobium xinjiangense]|uniref:AroM family protein n=1 Tax=Mesorhizobium xinjiangense TaxID=2678685 RepID=UPI0012EDEF1B|nr:AroM family protein [Mesorhizobium xinjiangense]
MEGDTLSSGNLGAITVGQAPRPDLAPLFEAATPEGAELIEIGVLDGFSRAEIERDFAPAPGEPALISRLVDGTSVVIAKRHAVARVPALVAQHVQAGCRTVLLLCTGHFPGLENCRARVIQPQDLLIPTIKAMAGGRRIGLMVAVEAQLASVPKKWASLTDGTTAPPPLARVISPYDATDAELAFAARELAGEGAALLVADCIGFNTHHRNVARRATGLPVVVSTDLLVKLISELV